MNLFFLVVWEQELWEFLNTEFLYWTLKKKYFGIRVYIIVLYCYICIILFYFIKYEQYGILNKKSSFLTKKALLH